MSQLEQSAAKLKKTGDFGSNFNVSTAKMKTPRSAREKELKSA